MDQAEVPSMQSGKWFVQYAALNHDCSDERQSFKHSSHTLYVLSTSSLCATATTGCTLHCSIMMNPACMQRGQSSTQRRRSGQATTTRVHVDDIVQVWCNRYDPNVLKVLRHVTSQCKNQPLRAWLKSDILAGLAPVHESTISWGNIQHRR